jgi:hypothetical protein
MYLFSQLASYLFVTFLLGVGVGYTLWRTWGEREILAKFNAAEMRLAAHLARRENAAPHTNAGHTNAGGRDGGQNGGQIRSA